MLPLIQQHLEKVTEVLDKRFHETKKRPRTEDADEVNQSMLQQPQKQPQKR